MQIDLYRNLEIRNDCEKNTKQIETRAFKAEKSIKLLDNLSDGSSEFNQLREKVACLYDQKREYSYVDCGACDNLFLLEALGVGRYCKRYTVLIDFSERLDYVLHRLSGCATASVRKIVGYTALSRAIMNLDFDVVRDTNFGVFLGLDDKLDHYLKVLLVQSEDKCTKEADIKDDFAWRFFSSIVNEISYVKDYCILAIRSKQPDKSFIYRSKSYSSVIASSDFPVNDELVLVEAEFEDCRVAACSYEIFQYALKGGLV